MSFTLYTPTDQHHTQLSVPDNGQADDSASLFDGTAKYNADNGLYLYNRNVGAVGGDYLIPMTPADLGASPAYHWNDGAGAVRFLCCGAITGTNDEALFNVPQIFGAKLDQITAWVEGDGGANNHTALPVSLPRVTLYSRDMTGGSETNEGAQIDTSGTYTAYDITHSIQLTLGTAVSFSATKQYMVSIRGESGTNSVADALALYGLYMRVVPIA